MKHKPQNRAATSAAPAGYRVVNKGKRGEIYIYGPIGESFWGGGVSAKMFADDLKKLANVETIDLRLNSEGGDVFDAKAMYSLLAAHKATVHVHIDGLAASAASFLAMAGNTIEIAEGGFVMIHNAWGGCIGGADEMRQYANLLEQVNETICDVYAARTKTKREDCKALMQAETWMTGKEALDRGFADKLVPNLAVAASVSDPTRFKNCPRSLRPKRTRAAAALAGINSAMR